MAGPSAIGGGAKVHTGVKPEAIKALQSAIRSSAGGKADRIGSDTLRAATSRPDVSSAHRASVAGAGSKLLSHGQRASGDTIAAGRNRVTADSLSGGVKHAMFRVESANVTAHKDLFVFKSDHSGGSHFIQSFKAGTDKLVLSGYGKAELAKVLSSQKVVAGNLTLKLSDKTTITISGHEHKLSASDIVIK